MSKNKKEKVKRKPIQIIIDIIIILLIIGLLAAAGILLYHEFFPNNTPVLKYEIMDKNENINWALLKEKNPDIVGWLKIGGTNIDTPVVQTDNNDKYLYTGFDGQGDERGVPFVDYEYCWLPMDKNNVIYGHSTMRSKVHVMFDDLIMYYEDTTKINKDDTIVFKRPVENGGDATYQIFAVLVQESDYDYRRMKFGSSEEFMAYYDGIKRDSLAVRDDVILTPEDEILTLSTCIFTAGLKDGRLAIIARRIK